MNKKRIVCVGNRYIPGDNLGMRVFDYLMRTGVPCDVALIDGGVQGLNLLKTVEGAEKMVFVDNLKGFGNPNQIVILDASEVAHADAVYGHSGGLAYMLSVLQFVFEDKLPPISVIGMEGNPDDAAIPALAEACLKVLESRSPAPALQAESHKTQQRST